MFLSNLPVALSVSMKIDYPGNIVSRPLINMKNPTSQTPNALYSAFRIPKSAYLFIGFFLYFFLDKKVPKNHGCVKKAKTRRAFWREESRLLQHSSAEDRCTKVTRTLPAAIAYDSSLYLFADGFLNAFLQCRSSPSLAAYAIDKIPFT